MKSSLRKLRGFAAFHRGADLKEKRDHGALARQEELLQASHDVLEMRNCYDSLLSAASATANSAYEFSEALQEMGTCLLEKTTLKDDEVSGRLFLILGRVQFELQKLVDNYRVHIIQTITTPSESLIKELEIVETMKHQCDDKRDLYKFMLAAHGEKGSTKLTKGESFLSQQLQAARDDYEVEANLFIFRLKSLKQGQSRSLLAQAARHHSAQLNLFRKGVKSLEMVEPHVKAVTEQQHIDYDFIGLKDDDINDEDNDYSYDGNDDGDLTFDYRDNEHIDNAFSMNRKSMEVNSRGDFLSSARGPKTCSQSAPVLAEKKFEMSERIKQMRASSPMKFHTYALPTPMDARTPLSPSQQDIKGQWHKQLCHSSPLEPYKLAKDLKVDLSALSNLHISHSTFKKNGRSSSQIKLPPPSAEEVSLPQSNSHYGVFDPEKIKRQAFSGPLIGKSSSIIPRLYANESSLTAGFVPLAQLSVSPRLSPSVPLPNLSTKNNELHELPKPPIFSATHARPSSLVGHSGPLVTRSKGFYSTSGMLSNTASPLPTPPPVISRSFSIPPSSERNGTSTMANFFEATQNAEVFEISSLPLTLMSFPNDKPSTKGSESVTIPGHL